MKLQKVGKVLLVIAGVMVCVFVGAIFLVFLLLPSAKEIKDIAFKKPSGTTPVEAPKESAVNSAEAAPTAAAEGSPAATTKTSKNEENLHILKEMTDETKPLSTVCKSLGQISHRQNVKISYEEFGDRFTQSIEDKSSDPLFESLKPFFKTIMTQPSVKVLMSKVENVKTEEEANSLMGKADFYYAAYSAYQEIMANQKNMERVLDQSYLMMMMGRAVEANPSLGSDPRVLDYCEAIEKQLNDRQTGNFPEEMKAFADFLSQTDTDPKSIGFDPNYKTKLNVVFNKSGLRVNGGWVDGLFNESKPQGEGK